MRRLGLCRICVGGIRRNPAPACRVCGGPRGAGGAGADDRCPACRGSRRRYDRLIVPWTFEAPLSAVLHALKFRQLDALGGELARELLAWIPPLPALDLVVPVPLHWRRRLRRGYNQAESIARPLARAAGLPFARGLARSRATPPQTTLDRRRRTANLRGAFRHARPLGAGGRPPRRVLLVDDVVTTGSTLDAAAAALRAAGVSRVVALAVARTPSHPRHDPPSGP